MLALWGKFGIACLVVGALTPIQSARADIYRIPQEYEKIQEGVDACSVGDTVLVSAGVYRGLGNCDIDFHGVDIVLMGGSTPGATVIDCEGLTRGIHLYSGETIRSQVQDLTIVNGMVKGPAPLGDGGGILLEFSQATIVRCMIRECLADNGGGIACFSLGVPQVSVVSECTIVRNTARFTGGGVLSYRSGVVAVDDCIVEDNSCYEGGGIYCSGAENTSTIHSSLIAGNSASNNGGGLSASHSSQVRATDTQFVRNIAEGTGGGVSVFNGALLALVGCEVRANTADLGGGMGVTSGTAELEECLVAGNRAQGSGGGVACWFGGSYVGRRVTVAGNAARFEGGGVYLRGAVGRLEKCIVWSNCAEHGEEASVDDLDAELVCSCVDIDSSRVAGDGRMTFSECIRANPMFCQAVPCELAPTEDGDYHLDMASVCRAEVTPCRELIGMYGVACGAPIPVERVTWGKVKFLFRMGARSR